MKTADQLDFKPSFVNNEQFLYPTLPQSTKISAFSSTKISPEIKRTFSNSSKNKKSKIFFFISIILFILSIFIIITTFLWTKFILPQKEENKSGDEDCRYGKIDDKCIECGKIFSQNKIIGGQDSGINSWPSIAYVVFKYYFVRNGLTYSAIVTCGGTLVNQDTVITAAHCFTKSVHFNDGSVISVVTNFLNPTYESMYTVYFGLHNKMNLSNSQSRVIKSFTIYPFYDKVNFLNDIAIIKLLKKVDLNEKVQVACLPRKSEIIYPQMHNIEAYIAGWGKNSTKEFISPDILQEAVITIYDDEKCRFVSPNIEKDWGRQICAGKYEGGVDSCQGDSGGPLFVRDTVDNKQKFVLAGVTSYGEGCAVIRKPGIYTRVSAYLDWISEKMNEK